MSNNPIIIFADYAGTLDKHDSAALIKTLKSFKKEGALLYMATDSSHNAALSAEKALYYRGHINLFDDLISISSFGMMKCAETYWQQAQSFVAQNKGSCDLSKAILIDDNQKILDHAKENNLTIVSANNKMDVVAAELTQKYAQLKNA